ncbi:MAG: imidazole glycerol phosphate synthase subunit HisF [Gammaproteobacteria bacterium]|nr:imidazole glycerol phosphate synthase subunit HisF [Gammaproteobacteria bacterium]
MPHPIRLIARLDIKGPNLVKGIHLEGLRVLGRPEEFAEYYYKQGIDELFYMDVVASLYERNSLSHMIADLAKKIFIPLTVGGGIRSLEDIHTALRSGADKVCINTAAIKNPDLIKQAVKKFGSSTIVVAIEAIRQPEGHHLAYIDNGREFTGVEVISWARTLSMLGVGELIITSVDHEGTGLGFDINLLKSITDVTEVPIIAHGGAGKANDLIDLFTQSTVSAAAIASILHYHYLTEARTKLASPEESKEGNYTFLRGSASNSKINPCDPATIKTKLIDAGVFCRV